MVSCKPWTYRPGFIFFIENIILIFEGNLLN
jgi:hypothetical protein